MPIGASKGRDLRTRKSLSQVTRGGIRLMMVPFRHPHHYFKFGFMARNVKIQTIEEAELQVAEFAIEEREYRATALASDGIDAGEQAQLDRLKDKITVLTDTIAALRVEVEHNKAIWDGRKGELDKIKTDAHAAGILGLGGADYILGKVKAIEQSVQDERWADATKELDAIKRSAELVSKELAKQTLAKNSYDTARPAFDTRLANVQAAATPEMMRTLNPIVADMADVDKAAGDGDYATALEKLNALGRRLRPLEDQIQLGSVEKELETGFASVGRADFEVGPPKRPNIRHDNGFLQNPADPNDPKPMPIRPPTMDERLFYASEVAKATGADAVSWVPFIDNVDERLSLEHGIAGYEHFLTGGGADYEFDYEEYLENDKSGQDMVKNIESDVQNAVNDIYGGLGDELPETEGASVTFQMNGGAPSRGVPYPDTEDWQKAIGGHSVWTNSEITLTRQADGTIKATAEITIEAEDRYNFNPGQADIATGAADSERGVLEETGLAKQFTQTGSHEVEVTWTIGTPAVAPAGSDDVLR